MSSSSFARRQARVRNRLAAGEMLSFAEIAAELGLPVDIVIAGYRYALSARGLTLADSALVQAFAQPASKARQ